MTKNQIAAMIQDLLNANSTPTKGKYDRKDISILIGLAYKDAVVDAITIKYRGKRIIASNIDGGFVTSYKDVPIEFDEDRQIYYSKLQASVLQLTGDLGLRQISPMEDESTSFIHSAIGDRFVQGPLEVNSYPKPPSFQVENDRVYYHADELPWYFKKNGKVLIKQVRDISDIDDDDDFNIPGGYDTKIVDWVLEKMGIPASTVPDHRADANVQNN